MGIMVCFLAGCSEQPNGTKGITVPNPSIQTENAADSGCDNTPKMSNAQIITDTHSCELAGLDAEAFHCGTDPTTIQIQCKPRTKE